jgi:hypothetical protein
VITLKSTKVKKKWISIFMPIIKAIDKHSKIIVEVIYGLNPDNSIGH